VSAQGQPTRSMSSYEAMRYRMVARMFVQQIAGKDERDPQPLPPVYPLQPAEVE
jgi:hypothetical protein